MSAILLLYVSRDGQTRRVMDRVGERLVAFGLDVETCEVGVDEPSRKLDLWDGVVVGAPVRWGKYPAAVSRLVREHRRALTRVSSVLVSVSLSAGLRSRFASKAERYAARFLRLTEWTPNRSTLIGGALCYTRYGAFNRWVLRFIAWISGADTDTSRDHEYTDWGAVDRLADELAASWLSKPRLGEARVGGSSRLVMARRDGTR